MSKFQKACQKYFNFWSKSYDRDLKKYNYCVPHKIFDAVHSFLNQESPLKIFDIGIGTGLTTAPFKKHYQSASITGIDISQKMLTLCNEKSLADMLCCADVGQHALPFTSQHFDLILLGGVLEYIEDPSFLLSEINRVLKPGGYAVMAYEPLIKNHFYTSGFFTGAVEETKEKLTLRRCIRDGVIYRFYKKHLHATNHIKNLCRANNLSLKKEENFNAYQWSHNKIISYDLLLLQK